ncbi:MAG: hypothetical protein ACE1ZF_00165 [Gemmatimonadales bacterium]
MTGHNKGAPIWNKFAVGMLAIATIAAARAVLRRNRRAEAPAEKTSHDVEDVADLYAAGL